MSNFVEFHFLFFYKALLGLFVFSYNQRRKIFFKTFAI